MASEMVLLCDMPKSSAIEYMFFLKRYDIECFAIGNQFKETMAVYVDEENYLDVSFNHKNFNEHERQLVHLLDMVEAMVIKCLDLEEKLFKQLEEYEQENDENNEYEY